MRLFQYSAGDNNASSRERSRLLRWGTEVVQTLFPVLLITYLLLILLETVFEGSVTSYVNLNQLLTPVIVVGVVAMLSAPGKAESKKTEHLTARNIFMIVCAGIGGMAIIWYKTKDLGWLSYVISTVSGGLIVLLFVLIRQGDEGEEIEGKNSQDN